MVSLSVYIAICQFNNLWLLTGGFFCQSLCLSEPWRDSALRDNILLLNSASVSSLPCCYLCFLSSPAFAGMDIKSHISQDK